MTPPVDAALNVFGKPYQTALSVLSLLKYSGRHIDKVYFQFEPMGSTYDKAPPYAIAEYLGERAALFQPAHWLARKAPDLSRLSDPAYRWSVRYQYAFERTDKEFLFILHNDVLIKKDFVGALLENIGGSFIIGGLGQCWNCPASNEAVVRAAVCGNTACGPETYNDFRPSPAALERLYKTAEGLGLRVRPYWQGFREHYSAEAWPLPECRVNEWGCLVNVGKTRQHVAPNGPVTPFGAFERCGDILLDTSVAWFRGLHRLGLKAGHFALNPYLTHWVGNNKMSNRKYSAAEANAGQILEKHFPAFVQWCRERKKGLFN